MLHLHGRTDQHGLGEPVGRAFVGEEGLRQLGQSRAVGATQPSDRGARRGRQTCGGKLVQHAVERLLGGGENRFPGVSPVQGLTSPAHAMLVSLPALLMPAPWAQMLVALAACLAVLAGSLMTVAAAATALSGAPAQEQSALDEQPCSHCEGCDATPCPAPSPLPTCLQASSNAAPTLITVTFELPATASSEIRWSIRSTFLTGLSPPPDPFPPRA